MAGPTNLSGFGCCAGGSGCTLNFTVTACGGAACQVTVTITQTSGGSYTATMTGTSPITFAGIPCGSYNYTISAPGSAGIFGSTTVTTTTTVTKSLGTPAGSVCVCSCCRWFPETLHLTSAYGGVTLTWDGSSSWTGCQTISYPGYTSSDPTACTPTTLGITLCHSVSCSGSSGGVASFTVAQAWVIGSDFHPFPPPEGSICCPIPDPTPPCECMGDVFRGTFSTTVTNPCASPIDLSYAYGPGNCCCDLPIGTVTITE